MELESQMWESVLDSQVAGLNKMSLLIKKRMYDIFDLVSFLVFVTWVVLFIRFFVFNPYTVVWKSMEPVFHEGDFIVVDKITPKIGTLERDDIIVFVPKWKKLPFIKRIIWLPWETVKIRDWFVYVCENEQNEIRECMKQEEWYLPVKWQTSTDSCRKDTFVVWSEGYFVLWDNRDHSTDSRCCFWLWCYEWANYVVYPKDMIWKVAVRVYPEATPFW